MNKRSARSIKYSSALGAALYIFGPQLCSALPAADTPPVPAAANTVSTIPEAHKQTILNVVNYYRSLAHLDKITWVDSLSLAAYKHSRYRVANTNINESMHAETPGMPEFTAKKFGERVALAGYTGFAFFEDLRREVVLDRDPSLVVKDLMSEPYHRMPFLAGGPIELGIGEYQLFWTFEFAGKLAEVSTWPVDKATGVPPAGTTFDAPNPMRIHGVSGDGAGYVVTVQFQMGGFTFKEATMTDAAGNPVKVYVNHPQNDPFSGYSIIMIPAAKLAPNTTYKCHIAVTMTDGKQVVKDWQFTTGDDTNNFEVSAPKA